MAGPQSSFLSSLKPFLDNQSQKELQLHRQPTMMQDGTETYTVLEHFLTDGKGETLD